MQHNQDNTHSNHQCLVGKKLVPEVSTSSAHQRSKDSQVNQYLFQSSPTEQESILDLRAQTTLLKKQLSNNNPQNIALNQPSVQEMRVLVTKGKKLPQTNAQSRRAAMKTPSNDYYGIE